MRRAREGGELKLRVRLCGGGREAGEAEGQADVRALLLKRGKTLSVQVWSCCEHLGCCSLRARGSWLIWRYSRARCKCVDRVSPFD